MIKEFLKIHKYIIGGIGLAAILLFILPTFFSKTTKIDNSKVIVDSLQKDIKLKNDSIVMSKLAESKWIDSVVTLNTVIKNNRAKIVYIDKYYDKEIKSVDTYNADSIVKFISNRYQSR